MVHEPQSQTVDREVRDMVNAITSRVTVLHKPGASRHHQHQQEAEEDENGVRIITLAGTNTGATMRTELDNKPNNLHDVMMPNGESDALGTYVNSNFQAVNNSIMFGSHYNTNDPGVHLDISEHRGHPHYHKSDKHSKKGKSKEKKDKDGVMIKMNEEEDKEFVEKDEDGTGTKGNPQTENEEDDGLKRGDTNGLKKKGTKEEEQNGLKETRLEVMNDGLKEEGPATNIV